MHKTAMPKQIRIDPLLKKMHKVFVDQGFEAFLVGGAVRDSLLGMEAFDWDLATNAPPEAVRRLFRHVIPTGIAHGTVTVLFADRQIEVTTYRTEGSYSDGRRPDAVSYTGSIEEDLSRRDFTINAMAASLEDGSVIDIFSGRQDLDKRLIRTVGRPEERFNEDGLRPIRALRIAARLGFSLDPDLLNAIPSCLDRVAGISIERFRDEFMRMLNCDQPSIALKLLEETKILSLFIPELASCRSVEQADFRSIHRFDVLDHLFYACDGAVNRPLIRLAALFHDIGKPPCKRTSLARAPDGELRPIHTFYGHEIESVRITQKILNRLRLPNKLTDSVLHLIREHMFHYESSWSDAAVRRFISRVGTDYIDDLYDLRLADVYGMQREPPLLRAGPWADGLLELKERIKVLTAERTALSLRDLSVNGRDLMAIGIPKGKTIGLILHELLDTVLDDPAQNEPDQLLLIAKNRWEELSSAKTP